MIRWAFHLAIVGYAVGWVADRWLRTQVDEGTVPPIKSLVVIDAPIERVWTVVSDIEGQPRWMADMKIGAAVDATAGRRWKPWRGDGPDPRHVRERTPSPSPDVTPPSRFAVEHEGTFTGRGIFTLEPGADGSTTIVRWVENPDARRLPEPRRPGDFPVLAAVFQRGP